mmetsp:Transcript_44699/g.112055  ORF Transcript_44699/g.112055 Transcript_44699/m.112055 type:complete len:114 (-) Transcript_44699:13-354(-)
MNAGTARGYHCFLKSNLGPLIASSTDVSTFSNVLILKAALRVGGQRAARCGEEAAEHGLWRENALGGMDKEGEKAEAIAMHPHRAMRHIEVLAMAWERPSAPRWQKERRVLSC